MLNDILRCRFCYLCTVKKILQKAFAFFMAAVLVLSTMSFTVHKHFCGSFLVDVSIVVPSSGCGMEQLVLSDSCEERLAASCCSDKQELVQGQDTLKMDFFALVLNPAFSVPEVTSWSHPILTVQTQEPHTHRAIEPPATRRQLYLLHDSFLI